MILTKHKDIFYLLIFYWLPTVYNQNISTSITLRTSFTQSIHLQTTKHLQTSYSIDNILSSTNSLQTSNKVLNTLSINTKHVSSDSILSSKISHSRQSLQTSALPNSDSLRTISVSKTESLQNSPVINTKSLNTKLLDKSSDIQTISNKISTSESIKEESRTELLQSAIQPSSYSFTPQSSSLQNNKLVTTMQSEDVVKTPSLSEGVFTTPSVKVSTSISQIQVDISSTKTPPLITSLIRNSTKSILSSSAISPSSSSIFENSDVIPSTTIYESNTTPTTTPTTTAATTTPEPKPTTPKPELTTTPKPKRKFLIVDIFRKSSTLSKDPNFLHSTLQVALKHINAHPTILKDYIIESDDESDANGDIGINALDHIMNYLYRKQVPIYGVIGPVNTGTVRYANTMIKDFDIFQMNFAATDPTLRSKTEHSNLFSLVPSTRAINHALIHFMAYHHWSKAAILFGTDLTNLETTDIERVTAQSLSDDFQKQNIENEVYEFRHNTLRTDPNAARSNENIRQQLELIKAKDFRILILTSAKRIIPYVLCQAYKMNMTNDKYYWILINQKNFEEFHIIEAFKPDYPTTCTDNEKLQAFNRVIFTDNESPRHDKKRIISNKTADEIVNEIVDYRISIENSNYKPGAITKVALYIYDCAWSLALTYHKAIEEIPGFIAQYDSQHKTYDNHVLFKKLTEIMENLQFLGLTGDIIFEDVQRGRYENLMFLLYNQANYTQIGRYEFSKEKITLNESLEEELTNWKAPRDRSLTNQIPKEFDLHTIVVIWILTFLATLLALWFFVTNIVYRKIVYIKMSSPNINNAIVIGSIFCYLAVLLYGLDSKLINKDKIPTVCNTIVIFLTYGYTLAYGALFSKTWRIYRIFTSAERSLQLVVIRDIHLLGVIFLLMVIDTLIIASWMVTSPYELFVEVMDTTIIKDADIIQENVIYRCQCDNQTEFGVAIFIYKGILLIFGLFLAWETRKINVAAINDSKQIGMAVYSTAVLASVGAICSPALYKSTLYTESYVVFAVSTIVCTTITLCLVFVPKIKMIRSKFEDPNFRNGRPILSEESNNTHRNYSSSFNRSDADYSTIQRKLTVDSIVSDYSTIPRKHTQESLTSATESMNTQVVGSQSANTDSDKYERDDDTLSTRHPDSLKRYGSQKDTDEISVRDKNSLKREGYANSPDSMTYSPKLDGRNGFSNNINSVEQNGQTHDESIRMNGNGHVHQQLNQGFDDTEQ